MRLADGVQSHPVVSWLNRNHPVIPCTDNPGVLCCDLSDHYAMLEPWICSSSSSPSDATDAIWNFAESCVDHIFAGEDVKAELRTIYKDARKQFRNAQHDS